MSTSVLAKFGVIAAEIIPAKLHGFQLSIRYRVNLTSDDQSIAYGAVACVSHADLAILYSFLQKEYGIDYFPYPVLAETLNGDLRPSLCYIAREIPDRPLDVNYIRDLAQCVRELKLPEWYAKYIESFVTEANSG